MNAETHNKLLTVITREDKRLVKAETKRGHVVNVYRLGHFCRALNHVDRYVDAGKDLRLAILNCFLGSLANKAIKACGLEPMNKMELQGRGYERFPDLEDE